MKAIDSPNALLDIELPTPVATGKDILVRVATVSVNPVEGEYKVLGWDAAGVVESVGEDITMFKAGDKVWYAGAIDRSGTNGMATKSTPLSICKVV